MSSERLKKKLVLLIGEIRKIKFIMQAALANEVYFLAFRVLMLCKKDKP